MLGDAEVDVIKARRRSSSSLVTFKKTKDESLKIK